MLLFVHCRHGLVVKYLLAKEESRVRFSLSAPNKLLVFSLNLKDKTIYTEHYNNKLPIHKAVRNFCEVWIVLYFKKYNNPLDLIKNICYFY